MERSTIDKAFRELAEYKKAEGQGLLIRTPVAKGDRIWEIIDDGVDKAYIQGIEVQEVSDCRIWANDACYDYDDIGRTVFLLREEAEAKMTETGKQPDTGWIPVGERMPKAWMLRCWLTVQHPLGGNQYTVKGVWNENKFLWENGKPIELLVLAWREYDPPEPYHPDRCRECFGAADAECGRCEDE